MLYLIGLGLDILNLQVFHCIVLDDKYWGIVYQLDSYVISLTSRIKVCEVVVDFGVTGRINAHRRNSTAFDLCSHHGAPPSPLPVGQLPCGASRSRSRASNRLSPRVSPTCLAQMPRQPRWSEQRCSGALESVVLNTAARVVSILCLCAA